ncbi:redoxin domain-containing protein [Paenibacillus sp. P26]|nr:redoxin domain-containing protein [Paenibacillus sp. P26]UUZ89793.1 redoxin domain-containing protein [Paenibacillus sp. P25]
MTTETLNVYRTAPIVGEPAPSFNLPSTKNLETLEEHVKLEDFRGRWLVFFFWPYDFTNVCPTEIIAFSDHSDAFDELDCSIVGASTDSVYTHKAWIQTPRDNRGIGDIRYPMASDFTKETARAYGVLDEKDRRRPPGTVHHRPGRHPPLPGRDRYERRPKRR